LNVDVPDAIRAAAILHERLVGFGADVASEWRAGSVRYHRAGKLFAIVKPLARRVDVGFSKLGRARDRRILAAKGRLPFVRHLVEVEAAGDVDTQLLAWLRESYDSAGER
jgi:hypothetical protein